jgi:hypothetical protein
MALLRDIRRRRWGGGRAFGSEVLFVSVMVGFPVIVADVRTVALVAQSTLNRTVQAELSYAA